MKRKTKIIIPCGYMGSGSSAITDFCEGISDIDVSRSTFEFVFLHCPNGVFDLEDKLLSGNTALRSDEALHAFYNTMQQLYCKKYWWVGHYKEMMGREFWTYTQDYVDSLVQFTTEFYWYHQENVTPKMVLPLVKNKILRNLPFLKLGGKKVLTYSPMWISYIEPEEFYEKTRHYLERIFAMIGGKNSMVVLDQLLLPHNLFRFENYFEDNAEVFVVDRDPRDVFISNKYVWAKNEEPVPYPTDAETFCDYYCGIRRIEKRVENPHVHYLHFEDLVYKYEETQLKINEILGIPLDEKGKFDPKKSVYNTQLFLKNDTYRAESEIIEKRLQPFLYEFPYSVQHGNEQTF